MSKRACQEIWYRIEYDCDSIVARSDAAALAGEAGFSRTECREISIAVSELATNIIKYASPGMISFRIMHEHRRTIFEVMAADWGRGITDVERALKDFHTDQGPVMDPEGYVRPLREGLGCGLAAVRRLMDELVVESTPRRGTRVFAIKARKR